MITLVLATLVGTWASFLVSLILGKMVVWPFVAGFGGVCLGWVVKRPKIREGRLFWITILGWGGFLIKLFSQMMVETREGIWAGGANVWGDWAGHVGYIANWVYGSNWPPQNPWYAGVRLAYPFLFDYTSAVLARMGLSIPWSMQLPGMVLGVVMVGLLFKLTERLTKSGVAGVLAVAIFMFSGGLGWVYLIAGQKILAVPAEGVRELTHSYEGNIQWVNFVISEMVPQRGIVMGITTVLAIFMLWWDGWEGQEKKKFVVAGVMAGLIPLFHAHSFMVVGGVAGSLWLMKPKRVWWYFFVPAGLLALPQLAYFAPQVANYTAGFMRWQVGWTAHVQNDNWVWFWVKNLGLAAILIPVAWITAWKKDRKLFWLYMPFAVIFVACNLWVFQPWENDNSKLLRFWYLASTILMGWWLVRIPKVLAVVFLVTITLAGAIDAGGWLNFSKNKLMMWSRSEMQLANEVRNLTDKKAVFLTTDAHNHWVVDLAGRKIVMGFRGWLWSWGINYSERERDVNKIFSGSPEAGSLMNKYGVDYVVIGPGERDVFGANEEYFSKHYPLLVDRFGQKIFDVRK